MTVTHMDNNADDLWLRQVELELIDDIQKTTSVDGFYSIDVITEAAQLSGYELTQVDHLILQHYQSSVTAKSSIFHQISTSWPLPKPRALILVHKDHGHYTDLLLCSASLTNKQKVVTHKWVDSVLKHMKKSKHSKLLVYQLSPFGSRATECTPTRSMGHTNSIVTTHSPVAPVITGKTIPLSRSSSPS